SFGGKLRVLVEKRRLDEQLVGAARELDDLCNVRLLESRVDHVGDSVSARRAQCVLLEQAKRDGQISAHEDRGVVRRPAPYRSLGVVQPGTDRKLEQIKPLSPHIDPQLLLKSEGEARRAMIEHDALDQKLVLLEQRARRERC